MSAFHANSKVNSFTFDTWVDCMHLLCSEKLISTEQLCDVRGRKILQLFFMLQLRPKVREQKDYGRNLETF